MSPRTAAALSLLAGWFVFFAPQLLTRSVTFYRDNLLTYLPLEQYLHERLLRGELPQWYPLEGLGVPLIGQIAVGVFHPATYLLLPLSPFLAVKFKLLLAYLVAEAGAYRFARALGVSRPGAVTAAFAFAFGGFLLGVSSTVPYVMSVATLPFVGWSSVRIAQKGNPTDAALLGVFLALIFLSGDPQSLLLSSLLVPIALLRWPSVRGLGLHALGAGVGGLLACIELLPARVCFAQSVRVQGRVNPVIDTFWAFHPRRMAEFLIPGFVPDGARESVLHGLLGGGESLFVTTVFVGGTVLLLALAGTWSSRRVAWPYAVLALGSLWLATGKWGGALPVLRQALPLFARFRFPDKYLTFFWVGLIPLVGLGYDGVTRDARRWGTAGVGGGMALGLLAGIAATHGLARGAWAWAHAAVEGGPSVLSVVDRAWALGLGWTAVFTLALGSLLRATPRQPRWWLLVPALVFFELYHGNAAHLPVVPASALAPSNSFADALRAVSPSPPTPLPRVFSEADALREAVTAEHPEAWVRETLYGLDPDAAALYGLNSVTPRLGGFSMRYATFLGASGENARRWGPLVNVCFHVTQTGVSLRGERVLAQHEQLQLSQFPCLPRAFIVGAERVADLAHAGAWLSHARPPMRVTAWEGGPDLPAVQGEVRWISASPEHLLLEADAPAAAALVLADEFAPGWTATVDGVPTSIYPTMMDVRGIVLPAGHHAVAFHYQTPGLKLGALLSAAGVLLATLLAFLGHRTRRKPLSCSP